MSTTIAVPRAVLLVGRLARPPREEFVRVDVVEADQVRVVALEHLGFTVNGSRQLVYRHVFRRAPLYSDGSTPWRMHNGIAYEMWLEVDAESGLEP